MTHELINPEGLATPESYTHVVSAAAGRTVYVAGQVADRPDGDLATQARQAFANVGRCLAAAGAVPSQVTKLTIFVVGHRPEYLPEISAARIAVFGDYKPADTLIGIATLAEPGYLIEVDAVAVVERSPLRGVVERRMAASPEALYRTWTERMDAWFAAPGTVHMRPAVGEPFHFETHFAGARYPHYGRFLRLVRGRLIELTWVTGAGGTEGAETVVTVELTPAASGTDLRLTHQGWYDERARDRNEEAWPLALAQLDEAALQA